MKNSITLHDEMGAVLVGQDHNPSILNPDFLWRNRIVPEETELAEDNPPMSTPVRSQCNFKNGLQITSDPNRISFIENIPGKDRALCYDTAKKYLRVVQLVRYTAVGINFFGFFPTHDSKFSPLGMLKPGGWDKFNGESPSAEITLVYPLARQRIINLTIQSDKIASPSNEQKVFFRGNFHHDIQAEQGESYKVAIAIMDGWEKDMADFKLLTENIINSMGEQ